MQQQGLILSLLVSALVVCAVALPSARLSPLSPLPSGSLAEVGSNSGAAAGAVGTVCAVKNRRGSCQDSKTTACDGFYESTPICGSGTIQCCVDDLLCRTDKGEPGRCMDVQNPADPTANFVNLICHTKQEAKPGMCPGLRAFVQCCIGAPSCEEFSNTTASVAAFIETQEALAVVSDEAELERRFDAQLDSFTSDLSSHRIVHQSARARVLDRSRPVPLPAFVEERSGSLAELGAVAHLTVPERQVQGLLKWLRQQGIRSEFVSAGHFGEEHQRLLANDMRFRQELQEAIPPVTPPVEAEIVNERIDVRAQFALQRLFKRGGKDKQDAIELFNSVRFSYKLKGIYGDDLGQVAKIAKQRKTVRWELVPKGEKGVILTDTVDENTPVLIFKESAGKQPDLDNLLLELYRAHRDLLSPVPTATGPACPPDATFFDDFRPYLCIDRFVQSRLKNPKLKKVAVRSTIGKSFLGKPIPVVTLNPSGKANTPAVLLTGGHHAREWLAISSLLKVFDTLVSHLIDPKDDELKKIFAKVQFIIVPVVNPDGYEYTWPPPLRSKPTEKTFMCDRRWRKNRSRRPVTGTCVGTDLNRNYNEHWCSNVKKPISPVQDACFDTFCGISPASEPETRAMQSLIDSRSQLRAMIDFHTFDQKVLFSFGHTPGVTISAASVAAAKLAAAKMTAAAGNPFPYEATQPGDGKAPGGGIDYFAAKMQARSIANEFSYAFELRPSRNEADPKSKFGFIVPPSEIAPTAVEALAGFKSIVQSLIATLP